MLADMNTTCPTCQRSFTKAKPAQKFCSIQCARKGNGGWNKGKGNGWVDDRGYRWFSVTVNGKRRAVRENRHIMEQHLGRKLEPWEIVHHKNEDPGDNRLSNLQLMTHKDHTKHHATGRKQTYEAKQRSVLMAQMREEILSLRKALKAALARGS